MNSKNKSVEKKVSKQHAIAKSKINSSKLYNLEEGVTLLKDIVYTKFDSTFDVTMKLGVDPRHSDQMVRGVVSMPAGTGKNIKVAVICKDERIDEARAAGADLCGSTEIIEDIKAGKVNFDVCIATPDMMGVIGQVARILGPKGLMPNPKLGTVTNDISNAVKIVKSGQVEFRVEKAGIIHAGVGKVSFTVDNLLVNIKALVSAVLKAKPTGAKGNYLKSMYMSTTMGPSVKLDLTNLI